jgi:hypothetical protein
MESHRGSVRHANSTMGTYGLIMSVAHSDPAIPRLSAAGIRGIAAEVWWGSRRLSLRVNTEGAPGKRSRTRLKRPAYKGPEVQSFGKEHLRRLNTTTLPSTWSFKEESA